MLIDQKLMMDYVKILGIRGILHIGANTCQELSLYKDEFRIDPSKIYWVEAIPDIVDRVRKEGIPNVYQAVLDETAGEVMFNVTSNNGESSSILELNTHKSYYPYIVVAQTLKLDTITLSQFLESNKISNECLDFIVMDIQGAELRVLRGSPDILKFVKMICTEINMEELYKGAGLFTDFKNFLESHGFVCISQVVAENNWGDALFIREGCVQYSNK